MKKERERWEGGGGEANRHTDKERQTDKIDGGGAGIQAKSEEALTGRYIACSV